MGEPVRTARRIRISLRRTAACLSFVCWLALPSSAPANLRAPWHIAPFPSFALLRPAGGLTVLHETLIFDCDALFLGRPDSTKLQGASCSVSAQYNIEASAALDAGMEFLGPSSEGISVILNGKPGPVETTRLHLKRDDAAKLGIFPSCRHCGTDEQPLYSIKFRAALEQGQSTIRVTYRQPLASDEISYGYFQTSRWAQGFSYELWPLREWNHGPDFRISLTILAPRPGFWSRIFSKQPEWQCAGIYFPHRLLLPLDVPGKPIQSGGWKETAVALERTHTETKDVFKVTLGSDFPDRLSCSIRDPED